MNPLEKKNEELISPMFAVRLLVGAWFFGTMLFTWMINVSSDKHVKFFEQVSYQWLMAKDLFATFMKMF